MTDTQQDFVARHYSARADAYVRSTDHSMGADLDQIEAIAQALGRDANGGARALDLGCGGGHVSYRVAPYVAEMIACDITETMLATVAATAAERGLATIAVRRAAAEQLPFADGWFDIVLSRFSAHHWADMPAGLREARRVLRPGGTAVFVDVVAPANPLLDSHLQTVELLRDGSHVRDYSVAEWVTTLAGARFQVESVTPRRLRLDFAGWIARTTPPDDHVRAIRSLQRGAPEAVTRHFAIDESGGFELDTVMIVVSAA